MRKDEMKKRYILFLLAWVSVSVSVSAQTDRQYIRMGNKQFRKGNYDKAEVEYSKALAKNKSNSQAAYNMARVLMHKEDDQNKDSLAVEKFKEAAKMEENKVRKAMSFHNIGWIFQSHEDYAKAIEAYKEALRNNPKDDQTRYNLALCQKLLKKQNGGGGSQNKEDKNQDKDKQDKKKQNQDKNKKDKQEKQQQKQQPKMSKENAEQLLNAAVQEEKRTQQRMQKALQQPQSRNLQKNW